MCRRCIHLKLGQTFVSPAELACTLGSVGWFKKVSHVISGFHGNTYFSLTGLKSSTLFHIKNSATVQHLCVQSIMVKGDMVLRFYYAITI